MRGSNNRAFTGKTDTGCGIYGIYRRYSGYKYSQDVCRMAIITIGDYGI